MSDYPLGRKPLPETTRGRVFRYLDELVVDVQPATAFFNLASHLRRCMTLYYPMRGD